MFQKENDDEVFSPRASDLVVFDVSAFDDTVLDDDLGSGEEESWLDDFTTSKSLGSAKIFRHFFVLSN